jgi:glycosyltransferase involved in cell wall biosynthesis
MKILIIHQENRYFGGAEVLLGQFLRELADNGTEAVVAAVSGSRVSDLIPSGVKMLPVEDNSRFSPWNFLKQTKSVLAAHRVHHFDLIHGWAARDWELAAITGWLTKRPSLGMLHDHPEAPFLPKKRRLLMRAASRGLNRIACVSFAVQAACANANYDRSKLVVVHNGIRILKEDVKKRLHSPIRLGFLGVFSERKGLRDLFEMAALLSRHCPIPWELHLAGDAQDEKGRALMDDIRRKHENSSWWNGVSWRGWMKQPLDFLQDVDLLVCPSSEFEPCPLVVCEAGAMGVPVLAARSGGIPEIIADGRTGWLYDPGDLGCAVEILGKILTDPFQLGRVGAEAIRRIESEFNITKMVAEYRNIYSNLTRNVWK